MKPAGWLKPPAARGFTGLWMIKPNFSVVVLCRAYVRLLRESQDVLDDNY